MRAGLSGLPRGVASLAILSFFISLFLLSRLVGFLSSVSLGHKHTGDEHNHYQPPRTLSLDEFPVNDPDKRVILVGDIHGSLNSLHNLLNGLSYSLTSDVLVHLGDIITRGNDTLPTLSFLRTHNITGVRGNNDQKVLSWYSWRHAHLSRNSSTSTALVATLDALSTHAPDLPKSEFKSILKKLKKQYHRIWDVPEDWESGLRKDHYAWARRMGAEDYAYLRALPHALHVPDAHAFVAHAGLVSHDPQLKTRHKKQPLAHVPTLDDKDEVDGNSGDDGISVDDDTDQGSGEEGLFLKSLRFIQERRILDWVKPNRDPWLVMNMRVVLKDGEVSKEHEGTPISDIWNGDMQRCAGYDSDIAFGTLSHPHQQAVYGSNEEDTGKDNLKSPLPCMPSTLIYGHAASRGLTVERWSFGLDSGCVYGGRLTALVVGIAGQERTAWLDDLPTVGSAGLDLSVVDDEEGNEMEIMKKKKKKKLAKQWSGPFGDEQGQREDDFRMSEGGGNRKGWVVSVQCPVLADSE